MKSIVRLLVYLFSIASLTPLLHADAYDGKPKLVVILVFDQFRGDYLDRYRADFKAKNGWNLFLKQGAHFTDCYYDYANLLTAAGHATIGTGAYTDGHGIPDNNWWQQKSDGTVSLTQAIDDDRYTLVGEPSGVAVSPGASPHLEMASTLGDELVLATGGRSRVYGVSLKDRAAILTSGHATRGAFWTDHASGRWITSTYWMNKLPMWVEAFNASDEIANARKASGNPQGSFYDRVGRTPASVKYQLDFAKALVAGEKLGNNTNGVTDMLTLSISSTDINGHAVGPDDPSQKALIVASDALLDDFFSFLDKQVGLENVMVAMTGDHGVSAAVQSAEAMGMPALAIRPKSFLVPLEDALTKRFPKKREGRYTYGSNYPYIQLNQKLLEEAGVSEQEAENAAREELKKIFAGFVVSAVPYATRQPDPGIAPNIYTAYEMRTGMLPDTQYGHLLAHSYSPYIGWALHVNYGPYQFPGNGPGATHFTGNSYDRHVPLDLYGSAIVPGTYHGMVAPVDIAATFASLLRINRPTAAVGHVLNEAIKPEAAGSTWIKTTAITKTSREVISSEAENKRLR